MPDIRQQFAPVPYEDTTGTGPRFMVGFGSANPGVAEMVIAVASADDAARLRGLVEMIFDACNLPKEGPDTEAYVPVEGQSRAAEVGLVSDPQGKYGPATGSHANTGVAADEQMSGAEAANPVVNPAPQVNPSGAVIGGRSALEGSPAPEVSQPETGRVSPH